MIRRGILVLITVLAVVMVASAVQADPGTVTTQNSCNILWLCPG